MFARSPRFVKKYADLRGTIAAAAEAFAADVRSGAFPAAEHLYGAVKKSSA
jgi:3-methyl-2-oxobutanoate hydroxymethyltransferase